MADNIMEVTTSGGFIGGRSASAESGGAIGLSSSTSSGGAIGRISQSIDGGAVGDAASAENGGAVGRMTYATNGGAIGHMAVTGNGFAGGFNAKARDSAGNGIDAIQLGNGENNVPKTMQVYDYQLMDENGNIPSARIPQLSTKAEKNDVYTKQEAASLFCPKGTASGYPIKMSDHLQGAGLIDYRIYGNAGGVGDLVAQGDNAGKYHIPVVCRGKNLLNLQDFAANPNTEVDGNSIIITGTPIYRHAKIPIENISSWLKPNKTYFVCVGKQEVLEGTPATSTFFIGLAPLKGTNFYLKRDSNTRVTTLPADFSEYAYLMIFCGENIKIKLSDIMIMEGNTASEYEPYCTPATADIYLDAPLSAGESISYLSDNLPALVTPNSGTVTLSTETAVAPSEISIAYHQDINKKLTALEDAVKSLQNA